MTERFAPVFMRAFPHSFLLKVHPAWLDAT
jgi:hypothetical protein